MVIGTVLSSIEFRGSLCACYNANPHNLQNNVMVSLSTFLYITELAADTEGSSSHVKMRFGTISSTLRVNVSPLNMYKANT